MKTMNQLAFARKIALLFVLLFSLTANAGAASAQATDLHDAAAQVTKKLHDDPDVAKIVGEHIVVAPFENINGKGDAVPRILQEMLTTSFIKAKHFKVLERDQLQSALDELHFQLSDLADPAKAKKIGKLAGAAYVLLGSISDTGGTTSINARIVSIETGESVAAEDVNIKIGDAPSGVGGLNPTANPLTTSTEATSPTTVPKLQTPALDLNAKATSTSAGEYIGQKNNFGLLGGTKFQIAWRENLGKDPVYAFSSGDVLGNGTTRLVQYKARVDEGTVNTGTIFLSVAKWENGTFNRAWESKGLPNFTSQQIGGLQQETSVHLCVSPVKGKVAQIILSNNSEFKGDWRWDGTTYSPIQFALRLTDPVLQWFSETGVLSRDDNARVFVESVDDDGKLTRIQDSTADPFIACPTLDDNGGVATGDFDGDGKLEIAVVKPSDRRIGGKPIEIYGESGRKAATVNGYGARLTTWNPGGSKFPYIVARRNTPNANGEPNSGYIYFIQWNGESYEEVWHSNPMGDAVIDMQVCDPKSEGKTGLVVLSTDKKGYYLTKIVPAN